MHSHRRRNLPLWVELPLLLLVAFCGAALLRTFALQQYEIPSGSMQHTLEIGDRVLVNKFVFKLRDPQRGEVVVFKGTSRWSSEVTPQPAKGPIGEVWHMLGDMVGVAAPDERDLIKRVIGTPGDHVACCDKKGRVTVNGVPLNEGGYVWDNAPLQSPADDTECRSRRFAEVTVPPGNIFVMGDHRGNSRDSRCQGFVPIENLIGRAVAVVWPKDRWASLPIQHSFDKVPEPGSAGTSGGAGGGDVGVAVPLLLTGGFVSRSRRRGRRPTVP